MAHDPFWDSTRARQTITRQHVGALIKLARLHRGWYQCDLAARLGRSVSAVSRLESRRSITTDELRPLLRELAIPPWAVAAVVGLTSPPATKVSGPAAQAQEEDPMRRRTVVTAAGLAISASLTDLHQAFAVMPSPTQSGDLAQQLSAAQQAFDAGRLEQLRQQLPALLANGHAAAEGHSPQACARLSACYTLSTHYLSKVGDYSLASRSADRARTWAEMSGSPLADADSARALSVVLRHQGQGSLASRVTQHALERMEATGLRTPELASACAQMMCTSAYTAAQNGDRATAHELIREAQRAARQLPEQPHPRGAVTPAAVQLYAVGVHWALGDTSAAVETGQRLQPGQFGTAERRGRLHTDMARAWWQGDCPEQAAHALLSAAREAPAEVCDRPSIRRLATDLARRHPRTPGARDLSHLLARPGTPA